MKKKPYIVYMAEKGDKMVAFGFIPKGNTFEKIALQGEPSQKKHLIEATTRGFNLWKKWGGADKEYESLVFDPWIQGAAPGDQRLGPGSPHRGQESSPMLTMLARHDSHR